ncbi:MAG: autotransporter outer membrane beta-barrel domain-containing protein [Sphingobium sp.]
MIRGAVLLGEGDNQFANNGTVAGDVVMGGGNNALTNDGMIEGSVALGDGNDEFVSSGTISGNVAMGHGNNVLTNMGLIAGGVAMSGGDDMLINSGTISGDVDLDHASDPGGAGAAARSAAPTAGNDVFRNEGHVGGSVFAGGGHDKVTHRGTIAGNVGLGEGDDELVLLGDWTIGGTASGGAGADLVRATFAGTDAEPREVNFTRFESFEQLRVEGGTGALSGTASFSRIDVAGGRLIGRGGSVINGNVAVATGAVFGSAGTVNGDIVVAGTLSPGSSPGTMTVHGDVDLLAGSNAVFEFTPTLSDAMVIDGALTIRDGAALTMTGNRPLTPGVYDLIVARDGVTGTFGTHVTQDSTVFGVLNYTATHVQLLGTFQARGGASAQNLLTTAYLNSLLIDGQVTAGILSAVPALLDADGYSSEAALSTLSPESYASAVEIGIENGLAISKALRSVRPAGLSDESGLFVFGQGYANWRDFAGDARGVSGADVDTTGFLGGVGFGNRTFGITAFIGKSDSKQRIGRIGARNDADGLFFGGKVHYANGGLEAGAAVIFDRASADTVRTPVAGGSTRSHYTLRGTTVDAYAGYGFDVGKGVRIGPEVGVTRVSTKRGAAQEAGGGAFALHVAAQRYDATFLTAALRLSMPEATNALRPSVSGGVRHQVSGDRIDATAGFTGTTARYTVNGVRRDRTVGYVGAGLEFPVGAAVTLFAAGDVEIDKYRGSQNINGGMRIRF